LQLSNGLVSIATKINSHKNNIGYSFIEIGKELIRAKEEDIKHGEWQLFLDEINMSRTQAQRHITVTEQYKMGKLPDVGTIGLNAMYEIATLPEEKRQEAINDDGSVKPIREIREIKKENKELETKYKQAESQAESERKERERLENELENQEPEVKEVFKEIDNTDYETIKKLEDEIEQLKRKSELESQDAETYRQLKKDIDNLRNRKNDIVKQIENASSIGKFIARIDRSFEEDLAPIKYSRAIEELERSESVQESLNEIVSKVENWCREIRGIMKNNNITEVIDYEEQ